MSKQLDPHLREVLNTLKQAVGNKRYFQEIEAALIKAKLELEPEVKMALRYLNMDLHSLKNKANESKKFF